MNEKLFSRIQVFDPKQEFAVIARKLPHWSQAGTMTFITFRTWDSMPADIVDAWIAERDAWLRRHGINPKSLKWRTRLESLSQDEIREFHEQISNRWNDHLDACHGECVLRRTDLSEIVATSLRHFDEIRYDLTDFVVMPSHVHLIAAFADEEAMLAQCQSWKQYTATKINRTLSRTNRFWQQDGFDHLVRSGEQFEYLRRYIADNPRRAHLRAGEFVHESKTL